MIIMYLIKLSGFEVVATITIQIQDGVCLSENVFPTFLHHRSQKNGAYGIRNFETAKKRKHQRSLSHSHTSRHRDFELTILLYFIILCRITISCNLTTIDQDNSTFIFLVSLSLLKSFVIDLLLLFPLSLPKQWRPLQLSVLVA